LQDGELQLVELAPVFSILYSDDSMYSHVAAADQLHEADKDKDKRLSRDEMLGALHVFYGSIHPDPYHLHDRGHRDMRVLEVEEQL
jgi:hypothetical protein